MTPGPTDEESTTAAGGPGGMPLALRLSEGLGPLPRLVACPLCGADKGYTLTDGSTYRWWVVSCAGCGNDLGECHADRTLKHGAAKPERWEWADEHWNQVGAYAQRLRDALVPLANAHTPIERECLTDEDCERAQAALCGPNVGIEPPERSARMTG